MHKLKDNQDEKEGVFHKPRLNQMLTKEEKTLTEIRVNAFNEKLKQPRNSEPKYRKAGMVTKKQEIPEGMEKYRDIFANEIIVRKTIAEEQNELELQRAWIRKRNGKIYDSKIQNLAANASNGSSILKQEISNSELRLQQAKSGVSLNELVQNPDPKFFVNDLEPYFRGPDKILRNLER